MRLLSEELGGGMLLLAADKLAVVESLLPSFTFQLWPPSCRTSAAISDQIIAPISWTVKEGDRILTVATESLAAMAKMSAHDTTPGHTFSTAVFMSSTTSNPLTEFWLGLAVFSPVKPEVSSSSIEPSHPYKNEFTFT